MIRVFWTPYTLMLWTALLLCGPLTACSDADETEPAQDESTADEELSTTPQSNGATRDTSCDGVAAADVMVDAPPNATDGAINGVHGGGATAGSMDTTSLGLRDGVNNAMTLRWSGCTITNGPGADFVVFENGFSINGSGGHFMDLAIVFVSYDGESWVAFPHDYKADDETRYSNNPNHWVGFAGVSPVHLHETEHAVDPFDHAEAGGDAFDLDMLPDTDPEAVRIKADGFRYLRLVTAPSQINPDTGHNYVREPVSNGADIDGAYGRYRVVDHAP